MTRRFPRHVYLVLIFFIGFSALIYEIYSVQVLFMFFLRSSHAVAIAISSFLAGLAISSLLFSRFGQGNKRNISIIFIMQLLAAGYGLFVLKQYHYIPELLDYIRASTNDRWLIDQLKILIMWVFLFLPAFFIGGALPLVNGLYLTSLDESARQTGVVYFWDMLGAILGALATGFILIPKLGVELTVLIPVAINLLICATIAPHIVLRGASVVGAIAVVLMGIAQWEKAGYLQEADARARLEARFGVVLFQKESPYGRVTVGLIGDERKELFINHRTMCETYGWWESEGLLGKITGDLVKPGAEVLNIGLGCGLTASRVAYHPNVQSLDIVEINPVVLEAAREEFVVENQNVTNQPHVTVMIEDGAQYLRDTQKRYDAIVIDIEEASVIYSSPLYTREYMEIAKQKLKQGGVLALWSFRINPDFSKIIYNTMSDVFAHVAFVPDRQNHKFYASDLPLTGLAEEEDRFLEQERKMLLGVEEDGINTLDNRLLEQHFSINRIFGLPDDYREPYVRAEPEEAAEAEGKP